MIDLAILVLRVALGVMFVGHGLQKTFGLFGGPGIAGVSQMFSGLGLSPALFWAYIASYTELFAGALLCLGLFTRGSAALLLILMIVAIWKVHLAKGFFLAQGGFEYAFLISAVCVTLILLGPGRFNILKFFK